MVVGSVTIGASPSSGMLGDVITFTGRVLIDGAPIPGLFVSIFLDAAPAPPVLLASGENDANGDYSFSWVSNFTGSLPIFALASAFQGFTSPTIIVPILTPPGFLEVHAFANDGVEVMADGEVLGKGIAFTTPVVFDLLPGTYDVNLSFSGLTEVRVVTISEGVTTVLNVVFAVPPPPPVGNLGLIVVAAVALVVTGALLSKR